MNSFFKTQYSGYGLMLFLCCLALIMIVNNSFATSYNHNGNIYHVNQDLGNDSNNGTEDKPFLTINKCAKLARAGDTCLVHKGTYRETVRSYNSGHANSPITFMAAPGENVRITGLDKLTSEWDKLNPSIFITKVNSHVKQLFNNDDLIRVAQYPNSDNYFKPIYGKITSAECMTPFGRWSNNHKECKTYDEDGPCSKLNSCWDKSFPKQLWRITSNGLVENPHWKGGIIAIIDKGEFNSERATIIHTSPGNGIEFEWFNEKPLEAGLKFTITNSPAAIDSDGEWSYDPSSQTLYYDPPSTNIPQNIYIRTRDLAFDLVGKKYITVSGFEIFAASIETGPDSSNCILDNLQISYPVYHQMFGATSNFPGQGPNRHKISSKSMGKGITLGGESNTLQNSTIKHSWCDGVTVYGSHNIVINNQISDVNWSMTACAAVTTNGNKHQVTRNKIHDCGRACLWHQRTFDSEFSYNDIYNACWLGKDCGITCSYGWYGKNNDISSDADGDGIGNVIHHNWIHDNRNADGGACLYLDNNEQDYLLHHNVLWGCRYAFILNDTYKTHGPTGHQVYNNTCFDVEFRISNFGKNSDWALQGVRFKNNLCTSSKDAQYNSYNPAEINMENNIGPVDSNRYAQHKTPSHPWAAHELMLIDIDSRDFRPMKNSPARKQGKFIIGITDESQVLPAAGAYEYGPNEDWKAGPQ